MIRKSAPRALKPLQAPPPPEFPPPFPASGDGVVIPPALPRVSPGNGALPGAGVSGALLGVGAAVPPRPLGEGGGSGGEGLLSSGDWAVVVRRLRLSKREAQIICLIVTEQKDRAIALELGISYNTLRTQLSRLYRKLGVQTRVGVMVTVFSEALKIVAEGPTTSQSQETTSTLRGEE